MRDNLKSYILNFDKCNQKCLFCMKANEIKKMYNLTYDIVTKEILEAKKRRYRNIDFYGGEPTCFPFLKKAVRFANHLGFPVSLATNAVKFSSQSYTKTFFKGICIRSVRTTMHSHKAVIHDLITQVRGSHGNTIRGIKNIVQYNRNGLFSVNIVITTLNYKDLLEMVRYIYKLGVRGIKFSGLVLEGRVLMNRWLAVDLSLSSPYLLKSIEVAKNLGFHYIEIEKLPKEILKYTDLKHIRFLEEA